MPEPTTRRADGDEAALTIPAAAFRDRVVRVAFSRGLLTTDEIASAWSDFEKEEGSPGSRFWRFVADRQRSGREAIYALAATTYGFDEIGISVSDVISFAREVKGQFSTEDWENMSRLRILPIGYHDDDAPQGRRLVFACSDPTRMEVNSFLSRLSKQSFVLVYAAATSIDYVVDRVLPVLFSGERKTSGRIFKPAVRLVPLDPIRDAVEDRGTYRRAA